MSWQGWDYVDPYYDQMNEMAYEREEDVCEEEDELTDELNDNN